MTETTKLTEPSPPFHPISAKFVFHNPNIVVRTDARWAALMDRLC